MNDDDGSYLKSGEKFEESYFRGDQIKNQKDI